MAGRRADFRPIVNIPFLMFEAPLARFIEEFQHPAHEEPTVQAAELATVAAVNGQRAIGVGRTFRYRAHFREPVGANESEHLRIGIVVAVPFLGHADSTIVDLPRAAAEAAALVWGLRHRGGLAVHDQVEETFSLGHRRAPDAAFPLFPTGHRHAAVDLGGRALCFTTPDHAAVALIQTQRLGEKVASRREGDGFSRIFALARHVAGLFQRRQRLLDRPGIGVAAGWSDMEFRGQHCFGNDQPDQTIKRFISSRHRPEPIATLFFCVSYCTTVEKGVI